MTEDTTTTLAATPAATATIATTHGSRYLQQLAKHWSHKLDVTFDETHATIRFPSGVVASLDAGDAALVAHLDAPDVETLDRMKTVLAEHLDRFAFREAPLPFVWVAG